MAICCSAPAAPTSGLAHFACNRRDPGSGCAAIGGENRWHAIFGGSEHCIAVHPSDPAVALLALDAIVLTEGPRGPRRIPLAEFYLLPGDTPQRETVLEHGELIVAVELPASPLARRSAYLKVRDRASFEFALVSVAAALHLEDGVVREARLALGGVAPVPWRARAAEEALRGQRSTRDDGRARRRGSGGRRHAATGQRVQGRAGAARRGDGRSRTVGDLA